MYPMRGLMINICNGNATKASLKPEDNLDSDLVSCNLKSDKTIAARDSVCH